MDWTIVVVAVITAAATYGASRLTYRSSSRANAVTQDKNQIEWVREMGEDAAATSKEIKAVRLEAATLANELHTVVQWIWQPDMTMEELRRRVADRERQRSVGRATE